MSPCSRDGSHGKVEIEEADGSSSGQKRHDLSVLVHDSIWPCSGRRALYHGHSVLGRRSIDREMVSRAERSFHEADSQGSNVETGKRTSMRSDVRNP